VLYGKKNPFIKRAVLKFKAIAKNPFVAVSTVLTKAPFKYFLSDVAYLKMRYRGFMGLRLNLKSPVGFNEKTQWLKLYNRHQEFTTMADKLAVRKIISELIGEQYLIPLLKIYNNADEIVLDELPEKFVLKCTHDSGSVIICEDKTKFDLAFAKKYLNKCLSKNYYHEHREYQYKDIPPRIIAEQYIKGDKGILPEDYKILCFHGEPRFVQMDFGRFQGHRRVFHDINWNKMTFGQKFPIPEWEVEKPACMDEMISLSRKIASHVRAPFVRPDFYFSSGKIYFGEITLFQDSGYGLYFPSDTDIELGKLVDLKPYGYK